jgi:hypothetical protein
MSSKFIADDTTISKDGKAIKIKYHHTEIVQFNDELILLKADGWRTETTKSRMNETSLTFNLGFKVYQKNKVWRVDFKGCDYLFEEGLMLER